MRALIFDGKEARLDKHHPDPVPAAGDAVIRTIKAGVSGTDLAIARGLLNFKGVLGHEFVGVVESIGTPVLRTGSVSPGPPTPMTTAKATPGSESRGINQLIGKRVVGQITTFCGACDMCHGGLSRHCRQRTILGMLNRDGCFADRFTLPAANLTIIPDSIDDDHAVFAHALAAAIQSAQQLTIVGKPYITVLGDGPLGLLMVQVMSKLNASVRLIGKHAEKLAVCEKWGVKHRHLNDIGRRADQDIVVDCTGSPEGLMLAMQLVHPRGKIVLKSLYGGAGVPARSNQGEAGMAGRTFGAGIDLTPIVMNEIELIGSHAGPIGEALAMITRREVDVVSLISRRVKLDDGAAILKTAQSAGVIKTLIET